MAGDSDVSLEPVLLPMALANDAAVRDGEIVGDPTEAALVVLAAKGGLDVDETRRAYPRVAEVPFDSEYKLMATFHEMEQDGRQASSGASSRARPTCCSPGRRRSATHDGSDIPAAGGREQVLAENDRLAGDGLRVLAVASRDIDPAQFDAGGDAAGRGPGPDAAGADRRSSTRRGKEARDAIALCRLAGIRARMITGDHVTTAAAIAGQLGIEGRAMSGAEFAAITDAELDEQVEGIGVVARVAPEDKVRLVEALKRNGHVVAMTGDGVNDAPALKRSDIGVAMGITGTEVTKEAADMILTDDNFATIVAAVEGGRGIYDNLMKYVRVQLVMLGRVHPHVRRRRHLRRRRRRTADAAADPVDQLRDRRAARVRARVRCGDARADAARPARRRRRDRRSRARRSGSALAGLLMAALAPGVVAWGEDRYDLAVATTMGLTTLSLMHIAAALEVREPGADDLQPRHDREPALRAADRRGARCSRSSSRRSAPLQRIFDTVAADERAVGHLPARADRLHRGRRDRKARLAPRRATRPRSRSQRRGASHEHRRETDPRAADRDARARARRSPTATPAGRAARTIGTCPTPS